MSYVSTPTPVIGLELISCQGDSATPGYGQGGKRSRPGSMRLRRRRTETPVSTRVATC